MQISDLHNHFLSQNVEIFGMKLFRRFGDAPHRINGFWSLNWYWKCRSWMCRFFRWWRRLRFRRRVVAFRYDFFWVMFFLPENGNPKSAPFLLLIMSWFHRAIVRIDFLDITPLEKTFCCQSVCFMKRQLFSGKRFSLRKYRLLNGGWRMGIHRKCLGTNSPIATDSRKRVHQRILWEDRGIPLVEIRWMERWVRHIPTRFRIIHRLNNAILILRLYYQKH